jgi:hypothetical protein
MCLLPLLVTHLVGDQHAFLLDGDRVIIYWSEYLDEIKHYTAREPVLVEPDGYAPENEVE